MLVELGFSKYTSEVREEIMKNNEILNWWNKHGQYVHYFEKETLRQ